VIVTRPSATCAIRSTPKSDRGERTLPLTDALAEVLKRARRRQAEEEATVGDVYRASGYVIVNEIGRRVHPDTVSDKWDQLAKAAGVRRIRLHDARHTCGTLMHLQGVPVAVIAAWLGHADPAFTMRTYVHSQNEALHDAARSIAAVTRT
jgi:integrase